ncbi:acyl-CoA dehydrogenase family protein [Microbacterium sp. GXF7504]
MTFGAPSEEQEAFRTVVQDFFRATADEATVRRLMATEQGFDREVWRRLAQEVGAVGIAIPAEYGGGGYTWAELGVVLEEAGRVLFPGPLLSTAVLAVTALLESDDEAAKQRHLPGIVAGETIATLAITDASGGWDPRTIAITATPDGAGWRLRGEAHHVVDGASADLVLVPARTPAGLSLFVVDPASPGVRRTTTPTLDQTRRLAVVALEAAPATLIGTDGGADAVLDRVLDAAGTALALEQAGGARAALEMSVAYLKTRVQFGQPIGAFQALKHMAADVLVEVESAASAAHYALAAMVEGSEEFAPACSLAQATCSEAFVYAAHQNIQFHGGMGFTWESAPHLYYKRARSSEIYFGDADHHRRRLAERIGI